MTKTDRSSGIVLHITSLPGKYGIGTIGNEAIQFIDFLHKAGQQIWQILPLGHTGFGDSPYQCFSTFAGNPYLIDFDDLVYKNWLQKSDIPDITFPEDFVDYGPVITMKLQALRQSYHHFMNSAMRSDLLAFEAFKENHAAWLNDYALFIEIKNYYNGMPWFEWKENLKTRDPEALDEFSKYFAEGIDFTKYCQFVFYTQWHHVREYAHDKGIKIIGDIPLYIAYDSADAWSTPEVFQFDDMLEPQYVAGVPPDYFSETGQLWGNPLYDWDYLKKHGFNWWINRIKVNLELYDIVRIDHFRGLAAYWSVPANEETAINGRWIDAPGKELFEAVKSELGQIPIIAEDLGVITPDVEELRDGFGLPGMKILQFAFDEFENNEYLPHNFTTTNCLVYTGAHDNDTLHGWYKSLSHETRKNVHDFLDYHGGDIAWTMIRQAWASVAKIAMVPMQDLLGLGSESRMNTPGLASGNWMWRFKPGSLTDGLATQLYDITRIYDRLPSQINEEINNHE